MLSAPPPELELFLALIFPWEEPHLSLYKSVTTIFPNRREPGGRPIVVNHAVQTYPDLLGLIEARRSWRNADVYVALGTQRMASSDLSNDGYAKAVRKATNVVSFKSLFFDIDVGKSGTYATAADADAALKQFLLDSNMPAPTVIVRSGSGGFHVYWTTDIPMPISEWQPLADGLKACAVKHGFIIDPAVTGDAARILRLPTTFNHKSQPAQPVVLDLTASSFKRYTIGDFQTVLAPFVGQRRAKTGTGPGTVSSLAQHFMGGTDERTMPKLAIDAIAQVCPMTAATLADGGAGKSEPQWSNDMYLAAWTSDPYAAAHHMSSGHAGYDHGATDRKLAEKQAAIANGKLGWPSCAVFTHAACKTCVLAQYGKSPVFFAHRLAGQASQAQPAQPQFIVDPLMPEGYYRNANHHVMGKTDEGPIDVLGYPILDGFIDSGGGELVLKTLVSGTERWGSISPLKQTPLAICEALTKGTKNGIIIRTSHAGVRIFFMAWMNHLQQAKRQIAARGFGWHGSKFVFGDEIFTPAGPQAVYRGNTIDDKYQRVGDLQPWLDAMQLAYGTPPLELLVASSFAGPLIELSCDHSVVLSLYSHQSGFGKSTAMKLAQAVWGHPRTGMSMLDDTENAALKKLMDLKNLPVYWDELKTQDQMEKVVRMIFGATQGRSKARLNRNAEAQPIGSATTLFAIASNHGIMNAVVRNTEGTDAGGLRVFEVEAQPLKPGISSYNSAQLAIALNDNYGCAGAIYADFLVRNKDTARQVISAIGEQLEYACRFEARERFWQNTMIAVLAGAHLANASKLTHFDIPAIQTCLMETLRSLRVGILSQTYTLAGPDAGESILTEMMADLRGRNLLYTDIVPSQHAQGRPAKVNAEPFQDPLKAQDIWMQVGKNDGRVLARIRPFNAWLIKQRHNPEQIIKLLKRDYLVVQRKASVGAGVPWLDAVNGRTDCYDMTPLVPPAPSHNPSSPFSNFGSP